MDVDQWRTELRTLRDQWRKLAKVPLVGAKAVALWHPTGVWSIVSNVGKRPAELADECGRLLRAAPAGLLSRKPAWLKATAMLDLDGKAEPLQAWCEFVRHEVLDAYTLTYTPPEVDALGPTGAGAINDLSGASERTIGRLLALPDPAPPPSTADPAPKEKTTPDAKNKTPKKATSNAKTKGKASSTRGDARAVIDSAIIQHHRLPGGGLNQEPIQVNLFAKKLRVSPGSVSAFLKDHFLNRGYTGYRSACRGTATLELFLKAVEGKLRPFHTYGRTIPGESGRQDD